MNTLPSHSLRCIMHSGVEPPLQRRRAAVCQRPRALANTGCRWPGVQHNCSSIPQQVVRVATAALLAGALAWSPCSPAGAETLTGPARAVDGDTLVVGGVRVRLYGVDAPESAQTCNDAGGKAYPCGALSVVHTVLRKGPQLLSATALLVISCLMGCPAACFDSMLSSVLHMKAPLS